jgi:hypothetical protein
VVLALLEMLLLLVGPGVEAGPAMLLLTVVPKLSLHRAGLVDR